jgi:hypothetical protein
VPVGEVPLLRQVGAGGALLLPPELLPLELPALEEVAELRPELEPEPALDAAAELEPPFAALDVEAGLEEEVGWPLLLLPLGLERVPPELPLLELLPPTSDRLLEAPLDPPTGLVLEQPKASANPQSPPRTARRWVIMLQGTVAGRSRDVHAWSS